MTSVDRLLEEYAAAFRSGDPDPWPFLDQVEGEEQAELQQLMDLFLLSVEPREWDAKAFAGSRARAMADRIADDLIVPPGGWSELLPSLRLRRKMERRTVDTLLAEALDAKDDEEAEKVAGYYHYMEYGTLDPAGVSDTVLDSLARIYGTTVKVLRRAGEATKPKGGTGVVYARSPADAISSGDTTSEDTGPGRRVEGKPDRIDRLFTDVDRSGHGR